MFGPMDVGLRPGLGWLPDLPDLRDYHPASDEVAPLLARLPARGARTAGAARRGRRAADPPARVDLREWCPPVEDQGPLGSCTAHAAVALVEYFERRAAGRHVDASRRFLYKTTRSLMHVTGDTGAYLRTTMKALVLVGAPPEEHWPYRVRDFDLEPPAFVYSMASAYRAVKYFHLDPPGSTRDGILRCLKDGLSAGLPAMFGFTVYDSIESAKDGRIPFPARTDRVVGGHAVMAAGYDDKLAIGRRPGALLIRNSWGAGWGEQGYGWLPYDYVLARLATDFWSIQAQAWVDSGQFGR